MHVSYTPALLHTNLPPVYRTHSCSNSMRCQHAFSVNFCFLPQIVFSRSTAHAHTRYSQTYSSSTTCTNHAQPPSRQTRLTTIWQVPPPHIADAPAPCPKQLLTQFGTASTVPACPTTALLTPTYAPADLCNISQPAGAPRTHHRRRSSAAAATFDPTLQRITIFFPQRVLTARPAMIRTSNRL